MPSKSAWNSLKKEGGGGGISTTLNAARVQLKSDLDAERRAALESAAREAVRTARERADALAASNRWRECSDELSSVLNALNPNDASLYTYRSRALLKQHRIPEALADAEKAVLIAPRDSRGHYRQARALTFDRQWHSAGESLVQALALSPRDARSDVRLDAVLGSLRRGRAYWPGPPKREDKLLDSGGPINAKPPGPCRLQAAGEPTHDALAVTWTHPDEDGGEELFKYRLEIAMIDPLDPHAPLAYKAAFEGLPTPLAHTCVGLQPDRDHCVRVAAYNSAGGGSWGEVLTLTTASMPPGSRELDTRVPRPWLELRHNMLDRLAELEKKHSVAPDGAWDALVAVWRAHLGSLKLAYRLYVLIDTTETEPTSMNLGQFRRFCEDIRCGAAKSEVDLVFTRVNRQVSAPADGGADGARRGSVAPPGMGRRGAVKDAGANNNKMGQDEFVHAILRLGIQVAERNKWQGAAAGNSLAAPFEAMMAHCVTPYAVLDLEDPFMEVLRSRGVKAALAKHREALHAQYVRWSGAELGTDLGAMLTMSLAELMLALKESRQLCELCTAREVASFFVRVNADDELYLPDPSAKSKGRGAAELDYDEFEEIVCRICREKIPPQEAAPAAPGGGMPFENTLDTWLGLVFIPALRNAGKAILLEGAPGRK